MIKNEVIKTNLSNYYGSVEAYIEDGKYYWDLESHNENDGPKEISKELYNEIKKYMESIKKNKDSNG